MTNVRIRLDPGRTAAFVSRSTSEAAQRGGQRLKGYLAQEISASGRVDTGRMRDDWTVQVRERGSRSVAEVVSNVPYTTYQDQGIGPVRARPGRVLRFRPKGMAGYIFRPRTRGFPGAGFMQRAIRRLSPRDFTP